ncbi:MAG: hypothetical protein KIT84_12940 [Labilithrix sp.]|nr:hypothetical protein [Labilithrix sp.]MCW5811921.1 hypothetical protein [Labilithrix sp.]
MGGKAKIENLTNTWYGFAVFSAIVTLLQRGIGVFTLVWGALGLVVSWIFVYLWGRALVRKSSTARFILIAVSALSTLGGAYSAAQASWAFVHAWELSLIITAAYSAVSAWIMAKSFRTLTDSSVKAYFA